MRAGFVSAPRQEAQRVCDVRRTAHEVGICVGRGVRQYGVRRGSIDGGHGAGSRNLCRRGVGSGACRSTRARESDGTAGGSQGASRS